MKKRKQDHFCGNCETHVSYEYPRKIFCSTRYAQGKNSIVATLWHCKEWSLISQECYCVQEALHEREKTRKPH